MNIRNLLFKVFFIILLTIIMLTGCSSDETPETPDNDKPSVELPEEEIPAPEPTEADLIWEKIESMSLDEKLGQLVMAGIGGTVATQEELILVRESKVGGIIFFQRNVADANQFIGLVSSIKNSNSANSSPLFLGIDEEGGKVTRLSAIFPNLSAMSELGRIDDPEISYEYGAVQAEKLKKLGLNLNFSPVLDVASNPANVIIGDRSISSDSEIVSRNGIQLIRGMADQGIVPVGKHFPGHGDTITDSHISLPVIDKDLEQLKNTELVPFSYAIDGGIPALMIGHLLVRALDDKPASVSEKIINNLLREELVFEGVVFSDDMTMGAVLENYSVDEAALEFIIAGGDIALICHSSQPVEDFLISLNEAVSDGRLTEDELNEKVYRILKLKKDMNLTNQTTIESSNEGLINRIESLKSKMGE